MTPRFNMVRWYSLPRLTFIGVRVAVSTVFGQFADRRASLAAERPLDPINFDPELDYSQLGGSDFWFDFVADTGDGWDSTYAVARLLGDASLALPNCPILPHGRVLVMGGDQVYPTPSYQDYRERLLGPFEQVRRNNPPVFEPEPHLYAVPGNHDWYDGLDGFGRLFRRNVFAGRVEQIRSQEPASAPIDSAESAPVSAWPRTPDAMERISKQRCRSSRSHGRWTGQHGGLNVAREEGVRPIRESAKRSHRAARAVA